MERLVGSEDSSHLIMIRGVDVFINAVSSELHLGEKENTQKIWYKIIFCPQTLCTPVLKSSSKSQPLMGINSFINSFIN